MSELKIKDLSKKFEEKEILKNISFTVTKSEVIGLIGLNGVGKSTLCKCISNKIDLDSGEVLFNNTSTFNELTDIMYVPDKIIIPRKMKIKDIIAIFKEANSNYNDIYIKEYLTFLDITKDTVFGKLSKGNQELIQLALLISNEPNFLILDEPLAAIDVIKRDFFYDKIIDLQENGVSLIITTHIMSEIQNIFTRILLLEDETITEDKSLIEIFDEGYEDLNKYVVDKLKK